MYKVIIDGYTVGVMELSPETVKRYNDAGIITTKAN